MYFLDVLPADDSHGFVSNSPFVNDMIHNALDTVSLLSSGQNDTGANHWKSFASDIVVPYDEAAELHPAFDFYRRGLGNQFTVFHSFITLFISL